MNKLFTTLTVGLLATFAAAKSEASSITINDTYSATFSVSCPSGCSGVLSSGALSPTTADAVDLDSANEDQIASYLTSVGVMVDEVNKFDVGSGGLGGSGTDSDFSFDVVAGYFFTKYANLTAFFYTETAQTVTFLKDGTGKGGLSNYGTVSEVPVPAAGLLLIGALGALGLMRRRRTA